MSGISELAAIIGVADVGFRCISRLYDFLRDLESVPTEIEAIRRETYSLQHCLSELSYLKHVSDDLRQVVGNTCLPQLILGCGVACEKLQQHLTRWSVNKSNFRSRIGFRWDRKVIDAVMSEIGSVKQTINVILTTLLLKRSVQSTDSVPPESEAKQTINEPIMQANTALVRRKPVEAGVKDGIEAAQLKAESGGTSGGMDQSFERVNAGGSEHTFGMPEKVALAKDKLAAKQKFSDITTTDTSRGNKFGVW